MPQAIIISQPGGPEVLQLVSYQLADPKPHELQIRHIAIEVNFLDIYHRTGRYPLNYTPQIPGVSGVGEVIKVGDKVKDFAVGDVIGYATAPGGAYSETRNLDADLAIALPSSVDPKVLASCLVKALTAHYLACRVFIVRPATAVLIHAAAGGVGKFLSQWCNDLGAYVIGTVGSEEKKAIALENGCHLAINYNTEDWVSKVREATTNIGVNAVYDSVGQATFHKSLDCLMNMGIMVLYGASSGPVHQIDTDLLAAKSLFFTRPTLFHYKSYRMELVLSLHEILARLESGSLKAPPPQEFKLADAAAAHQLVESRQSNGSIILIP